MHDPEDVGQEIYKTMKNVLLLAHQRKSLSPHYSIDENTRYSIVLDDMMYGNVFMDSKLDDKETIGLTDSILLAIVKHRYQGLVASGLTAASPAIDLLNALLEIVESIEKAAIAPDGIEEDSIIDAQ